MSNLTQVILPHLAALRLLISDILSFGRVGEQIGEAIQRKATFRVSQAITRMILDGAIGDEPTYGDLKYLSMETLRHSLSDNSVVGIPISRIQMLVSAFQAVAALGHNAPVCSDPNCGRFPLIQQEDRSFAFQQSTTTGKMTGTVCPTCGTLIQGMAVRTHEIAWPTNRSVLFGTRFDTVSMTGVALPLQDADIPPYLAEYFYGEINHTIRSTLERVGCPVSKFLRYLRHYSEIKGTIGTPHDLLGRLIEPKLPIQTLEVFATRAKDLSDEVEEIHHQRNASSGSSGSKGSTLSSHLLDVEMTMEEMNRIARSLMWMTEGEFLRIVGDFPEVAGDTCSESTEIGSDQRKILANYVVRNLGDSELQRLRRILVTRERKIHDHGISNK